MKVRKGVKRLAIAVGVPYFGFWALYAFSGYRMAEYTETELSKVSLEDYRITTLSKLNAEANGQIAQALIWGVFWPLVGLIALGIGIWVYRGFKPKP